MYCIVMYCNAYLKNENLSHCKENFNFWGSSVVGMGCGRDTLGSGDVVCVSAVGRRRAEGERCTGAMRNLGDGACGAGEMTGTAGGDRRPAAESKIVTIWRMARSWSWPSLEKGAVGDRFSRASIKLHAAHWLLSAEDV